jgi:bacteriocin immunity protein
MLEALKKRKIFNVIKGIIVGKPIDEIYYDEYKEILIKVTSQYNLPIIYNLNFGHALPHLILPYGRKIVIDFNKKEITLKNGLF